MGHWAVSGPEGSLRWLAARGCRAKVLVHVNNTNPLLIDDGPARAVATELGVLVGSDGWEETL